MLFELANIHARILAVESRAALVEPLEKRVAELERELAAATAARARLAAKLGEADDEVVGGSRPRPHLLRHGGHPPEPRLVCSFPPSPLL